MDTLQDTNETERKKLSSGLEYLIKYVARIRSFNNIKTSKL